MTSLQSITSKKNWLWLIIAICSLIACYLGFICLVSIWIGFKYMSEHGFWVPVVCGIVTLTMLLWVFSSAVRLLLNIMKDEDEINVFKGHLLKE